VTAEREDLISSGKVDIVVATYTINDERKKRIDFAGPYFVAQQDIMVRADDTSIKSADDLNGRKVCTLGGLLQRKTFEKKYLMLIYTVRLHTCNASSIFTMI
jgi:glutamate transport system substrate-binding protein